jgi:hypothetical protein
MKNIVLMSLIIAAAVLASCGNKKQPTYGSVKSSTVEVNHNKTVFGICGDGTAMNTLQLITDSGDTLELGITAARDKNQVFGGLQCGDRMAVMLSRDKTEATLVINESSLLGNWIQPNPIDGSSDVGISIKEGGIAESIDQSSILYKTWKINNGKLEITLRREGGGDQEETNTYWLKSLGNDSLVYTDGQDDYAYSRRK